MKFENQELDEKVANILTNNDDLISMSSDVLLCDVCKKNKMHGVFASAVGPISFAYCEDCASKGAEPYNFLIAHISSAYSLDEWDNPASQLHYRDSQFVKASLDVAGKTFTEWVSDVRQSIIAIDEEMNRWYGQVEKLNEVTHEQKVYSYSELASVFSKPEDQRLVDVVAEKYQGEKVLMVDYHGEYHLFNVHGTDEFTYHNVVIFVPEGDPRLNR